MPDQISYSTIASIILKQINIIRSNPKLLKPHLEERLKKYDKEGNYFPLPGLNFSVKTEDGKKGVENLIEYLESRREGGILKWSLELHQAADKRCRYLCMSQENRGNPVSTMEVGTLVSQFGQIKGQLVQLTFYGFIEPIELICQLLLEDGRSHKENREQFFNHMSNFIGIGISEHPKYRFVVVLIMAMHVVRKQGYFGERRNSEPISTSSNDQLHMCGHECTIY